MDRIFVTFAGLRQCASDCNTISASVSRINADFQRTANQLDWDVRMSSNINTTANRLGQNLDACVRALRDYQLFLDDANRIYSELENWGAMEKGNLSAEGLDLSSLFPMPSGSWMDRITDAGKDMKDFVEWYKLLSAMMPMIDYAQAVGLAGLGRDIVNNIITPAWDFTTITLPQFGHAIVGGAKSAWNTGVSWVATHWQTVKSTAIAVGTTAAWGAIKAVTIKALPVIAVGVAVVAIGYGIYVLTAPPPTVGEVVNGVRDVETFIRAPYTHTL